MALQGPLGDRDFRVGGAALRQQGHHGSERHDFSHVSCRDLSGLWDRAHDLSHGPVTGPCDQGLVP